MSKITIVGLGPGAPELLTREAWDVLSGATAVWLRTVRHPVVASLAKEMRLHSFDSLYEDASSFEEVYTAIVGQVLDLACRTDGAVYAVPGHPLVGEATVTAIRAQAHEIGIPVRIVAGLSFLEPTLTVLNVDALDGLQIFDALNIIALHHPMLRPDLPALIAQVYSRAVASEIKLALMQQYPDKHKVALIDAAGTSGESINWLPLYEIDRHAATPLTSLYIAPLNSDSSFESFQETIAHLRSPEGCPWDREQTHESLRANLLEECYEVLTAIDQRNYDALREELGDLLLQIVLQTQIAEEEGEFWMTDVISGINAKLKHRHPHVWGDVQVSGSSEVTINWESLKRKEREESGLLERSLLDGVPKTLPALAQAYAYGSRVARVGFDWPELQGVTDKIQEEITELVEASSDKARACELGDLLFAVVNWARWLEINPESALREANERFAQRFYYIEQVVAQQGKTLEDVNLQEMDRLWDEAKLEECHS